MARFSDSAVNAGRCGPSDGVEAVAVAAAWTRLRRRERGKFCSLMKSKIKYSGYGLRTRQMGFL
jgi:hypothetical protein